MQNYRPEIARTPVAPKLLGTTQTIAKSQNPLRTKTTFRTAPQPNRISSRFVQTENNNRHYTSTSLRNQNFINRFNPQSTKKSNNTGNNNVLSRLTNVFSLKTQKNLQSVSQITHKTPQVLKVQQPQSQETQPQTDRKTHHHPSSSTSTRTINSSSSVQSKTIKYNVQVNDKIYKVLRKLGFGGSAKVYEALEPKTMNPVAIKIIDLAVADEKSKESYFNEMSILSKLRDNRHVVHMFDSEHKVDLNELVIVMEKGDADLSQVIENHAKSRKNDYIDGIFIKYYWLGMVKAVNEIHKHGVVHADLKPVNFILVKNQVKLIDFGIANAVEPDSTSIIRDYHIGTINYMAPESLRNRALDASFQANNPPDENNPTKKTVIKYNSKADIWSLGCILYNLVYGRPPFDKYGDVVSKMQAITNPRHQINFPVISHQKLSDCMKSCLRYDVSQRPSAEDLLRHPYLSDDLISLL